MRLFRKLFGKKPDDEHVQTFAEQAVIVHLETHDSMADELFTSLEEALIAMIDHHDLGEYDGNEFGHGSITLFIYGPDAELIFSTIEPVLRGHELGRTGHVTIRAGSPGATVRIVDLDE